MRRERHHDCRDCVTFKDWTVAETWRDAALMAPPKAGSIVPETYVYCDTVGAVVCITATPDDNMCEEFEKAVWE